MTASRRWQRNRLTAFWAVAGLLAAGAMSLASPPARATSDTDWIESEVTCRQDWYNNTVLTITATRASDGATAQKAYYAAGASHCDDVADQIALLPPRAVGRIAFCSRTWTGDTYLHQIRITPTLEFTRRTVAHNDCERQAARLNR